MKLQRIVRVLCLRLITSSLPLSNNLRVRLAKIGGGKNK